MNKFTSFLAPLMQAYVSYQGRKHPDIGIKLLMNQISSYLTGTARNNIRKLLFFPKKWWIDGAINATRKQTIHVDQESMLLPVLYDT